MNLRDRWRLKRYARRLSRDPELHAWAVEMRRRLDAGELPKSRGLTAAEFAERYGLAPLPDPKETT